MRIVGVCLAALLVYSPALAQPPAGPFVRGLGRYAYI